MKMSSHVWCKICPDCGLCEYCQKKVYTMNNEQMEAVVAGIVEDEKADEKKKKIVKDEVANTDEAKEKKMRGYIIFRSRNDPEADEQSENDESEVVETTISLDGLKQYSLEFLAKGGKKLEEMIMERHLLEKEKEEMFTESERLRKLIEKNLEKQKVIKKEIAKYEALVTIHGRLIKANTREQYYAIEFGMSQTKYAADGYQCGCMAGTNCECL